MRLACATPRRHTRPGRHTYGRSSRAGGRRRGGDPRTSFQLALGRRIRSGQHVIEKLDSRFGFIKPGLCFLLGLVGAFGLSEGFLLAQNRSLASSIGLDHARGGAGDAQQQRGSHERASGHHRAMATHERLEAIPGAGRHRQDGIA
jgi:hypothetical protein